MCEVSVLVLSYNSSKTIIETLDSVFHQTYKKLHLLVSDDSSTDDTYKLAREWVDAHKDRFITAVVRRTKKNLGISEHSNTCLEILQTDWFKGIAADDILLPDCIEKYMDYINKHDCHGIVYAKHLCFKDENGKRCFSIDYEEELYQKQFAILSAKEQRVQIAKREVLCTPSCFLNRIDILNAGGYDSSIRNIEDWPMKMRLLDRGYQMHRIDEYTVLYRLGDSISRSSTVYFKPEFIKMERDIKVKYCYPTLRKSLLYKWNEGVNNFRYNFIINYTGNKRTKGAKLINYIIGFLNTDKVKKAVVNILNKRRASYMVEGVCKKYGLC